MERDDLYLREWPDLKEKESDERAWLKERPSIWKERFGLKKTSLTRKGGGAEFEQAKFFNLYWTNIDRLY